MTLDSQPLKIDWLTKHIIAFSNYLTLMFKQYLAKILSLNKSRKGR